MLHIWDKYICCNISGFVGEATKICITSVRIKKHKISICIALLPSTISAALSSFSCSTLIWAIGNRKDSTHSHSNYIRGTNQCCKCSRSVAQSAIWLRLGLRKCKMFILYLLHVFCSLYSDHVQMKPISVVNFHAQLRNQEYGRDWTRDTLQIIHLFPIWGDVLWLYYSRSIMHLFPMWGGVLQYDRRSIMETKIAFPCVETYCR